MSKKINWGELLQKSWQHLIKNRALWYLGVLAALTEGGTGGNFGGSSSWQNDNQDISKYGDQAMNWINAHYWQLGIVLLALFLISLVILYVSYSSRAALIHSVNELESSDTKPDFQRDFHIGQKYFWRFFGHNGSHCPNCFGHNFGSSNC